MRGNKLFASRSKSVKLDFLNSVETRVAVNDVIPKCAFLSF